jgi:hypothetical protein
MAWRTTIEHAGSAIERGRDMVANLCRIECLAVAGTAMSIARFTLRLNVKFDRHFADFHGDDVVAPLFSREALIDSIPLTFEMLADGFNDVIFAKHLVRLSVQMSRAPRRYDRTDRFGRVGSI